MGKRRDKPTDANKYIRASRHLFDFAVEHGWMKENPAKSVALVPLPNKKTGFLQWEEEDLAKFEARWPVGTRARLAMDLLLYTGVRRSDVVRLGLRTLACSGTIDTHLAIRNPSCHKTNIIPAERFRRFLYEHGT